VSHAARLQERAGFEVRRTAGSLVLVDGGDLGGLLDELEGARAFRALLEEAHKEHLRTGDYAVLGMAAQDALRGATA
jgi:hypothetical protein